MVNLNSVSPLVPQPPPAMGPADPLAAAPTAVSTRSDVISLSASPVPVQAAANIPAAPLSATLTTSKGVTQNVAGTLGGLPAAVATRTVSMPGVAESHYQLGDGADRSRNVTRLSAREGAPSEPYRFTVQLNTLNVGDELSKIDTYLLIATDDKGTRALPDQIAGTARPWRIAVAAYDNANAAMYDENGRIDKSQLKEAVYDAGSRSVALAIDKAALRARGWKDGDPLQVQAFTSKDFSGTVTDSLDAPTQKPWANGGQLTAFLDTANPHDPKPQPQPVGDNRNWRDEIVYFLLTDRFHDGDATNNVGVDKSNIDRWHGGDLQGLIDKLDYIKSTGATAMWITPTMANQDSFVDTDGYHGYWVTDYFKVDKHLGDMAKFKELVDKAHEKGLKVILDMPLNHVGWEHPMYKGNGDTPGGDKYDWFHHNGDVKDWDNDWQLENCSIFGLPDLAQEKPEVARYLIDAAKFWVDTGVDGFRLDAVRSVPLSFWKQFDQEIHQYAGKDFLLIGEYFHGDPTRYKSFKGSDMDALVDYPLYYTIEETFAKGASMKDLADRLDQANANYPNPDTMGVFLDNHDTERFLTQAGGDTDKLKLALAFSMTVNRMPIHYYGTETGMQSDGEGWSETSRKDMDFEGHPDLQAHFQKLTSIRNECLALRQGSLLEMWRDDQVFAFDRLHAESEALVALNNGAGPQTRDIPLRAESRLKDGVVLRDMMSGDLVMVKDGKVHVDLAARSAAVYVPL